MSMPFPDKLVLYVSYTYIPLKAKSSVIVGVLSSISQSSLMSVIFYTAIYNH